MAITNSKFNPSAPLDTARDKSLRARIQNSKLNNSSKSSSISGKPRTMAELLASVKTSFVTPHKGDILKGTITKLTPSEILIDIGGKTEAVVLEKDRKILRNLLSMLKLGDLVDVSVLNPESESGNTVVSLRRFIGDALWKKLSSLVKTQEAIDVTVMEVTRGGLVVAIAEGISGFLPHSHMLHEAKTEDLSLVGKSLKVYVLEVARSSRKVIFSQKKFVSMDEFENAAKKLASGQKVEALVTNVTSFGVFVSVPIDSQTILDGLIHISEIAWDKVEDLVNMFSPPQKVEALVIGLDREARRVDLSIKRLSKDPFEEAGAKFVVDQKVKGIVKEILPSGLSLEISLPSGESIEGFMRKDKIPPTVTYNPGDSVSATVSQIDKVRHRIIVAPVLLEKPIGYR